MSDQQSPRQSPNCSELFNDYVKESIYHILKNAGPDGMDEKEITACVDWVRRTLVDYSLLELLMQDKVAMRFDPKAYEPTFRAIEGEFDAQSDSNA